MRCGVNARSLDCVRLTPLFARDDKVENDGVEDDSVENDRVGMRELRMKQLRMTELKGRSRGPAITFFLPQSQLRNDRETGKLVLCRNYLISRLI